MFPIPWRPLVVGLIGGMLGVALAGLVWTAIVDHSRISQVWDLELQRAAAAQKAK
jgi:ABC-type uncharacterized transport system permease subunit